MNSRRLTDAERRELLRLAREAVSARVMGTEAPTMHASDVLSRLAGAFVTLRLGAHLRGCIGYPEAREPLAQVVARCAAAASADDPRFPPLERDELPAIAIEISVLGPIEPVSDHTEIEVGRHGLIIQQGRARGLLLPQVAVQHDWDRESFLSQTCLKAGLMADVWRHGAEIFRFEAEVFGEGETVDGRQSTVDSRKSKVEKDGPSKASRASSASGEVGEG